ncbi:MAG: hypothetical protein H8E98_03225 [Bacteroidetes bacterium]|nr:hypothetical protein [Bacteroidota bacterium]
MTILKPKDFIKSVLVDEVDSMIEKHPYISFIIMGIGIEFLGKCIDTSLNDWNVPGRSKRDFEKAINDIPSLQKYSTYLSTFDLYGSFRCGLAHAVSPKYKITLSSKDEMGHLVQGTGRLNLKVEDFYADFKSAGEYVISLSFTAGDKMEGDFLHVPGTEFNSGTEIKSGATSSLEPPTGATSSSSSSGATS